MWIVYDIKSTFCNFFFLLWPNEVMVAHPDLMMTTHEYYLEIFLVFPYESAYGYRCHTTPFPSHLLIHVINPSLSKMPCICTLSIREDSQTVDVVGVTVIDLNAFSCHHPSSDTGIIATGEKLQVVQHS